MDREEGEDTPSEHASGKEGDGNDDHGVGRDGESKSDSEGFQLEDGSDTARIAHSVTEYVRRCLQTGAFPKAMVALQSAVAIAEMPSQAYRHAVFQTAQVLKAVHEFEVGITCMQASSSARLYEETQRRDFARCWKKKLGGLCGPSARVEDDMRGVWLELAEQAFEQQDFVFAADFYAQSLVGEGREGDDARTIYRYLFSLTQFTGPCDASHRQQRQLAAWRLAQQFRCNRRLYGEAHYWRLRDLYARYFPSIYRAVFGWDEVFARRIARWWKARCSSTDDSGVNDADGGVTAHGISMQQEGGVNRPLPLEEREHRKMAKKRSQGRETETSPHASAAKMPSRTRVLPAKRTSPSRHDTKEDKTVTRSANNAEASDGRASQAHRSPAARFSASKPTPDYYEASPTKRKFGAVRRLRKQRLSDDVRPASPTPVASAESAPSETTSRPESLLALYPLRVPSQDDDVIVLATGRKPGVAELDVQELEEFARIAHYRARVIGAKHVEAKALDPERVKPRWLLDLDKAVDFLTSFQRSRQRLGDDSIAHLAEIHARLVLQLTAIHRQYVSEFGVTSFTLRLQSLTLQLSSWKFQRVAELTDALEAAKRLAMEEEKRRNLEFYHIHR